MHEVVNSMVSTASKYRHGLFMAPYISSMSQINGIVTLNDINTKNLRSATPLFSVPTFGIVKDT